MKELPSVLAATCRAAALPGVLAAEAAGAAVPLASASLSRCSASTRVALAALPASRARSAACAASRPACSSCHICYFLLKQRCTSAPCFCTTGKQHSEHALPTRCAMPERKWRSAQDQTHSIRLLAPQPPLQQPLPVARLLPSGRACKFLGKHLLLPLQQTRRTPLRQRQPQRRHGQL